MGLDRLIYGLAPSEIYVFDPRSLELIEEIDIPSNDDVRGVSVDQSGRIFVITWDEFLREYDRDGNIVNSLDLDPFMTGGGDPLDLNMDMNGNLLIGDRRGRFYLADKEFTQVTEFMSGSSKHTMVAFNTSPVPEPSPAGLFGTLVIVALVVRRLRRSYSHRQIAIHSKSLNQSIP